MKIIFVTQVRPHPAISGDSIRVNNLLKALKSFASIHFVLIGNGTCLKSKLSEIKAALDVESFTYLADEKLANVNDRLKSCLRLQQVLSHNSRALRALTELAETIQPDIAWLDYGFIAHYQTAFSKLKTKVIFDTHNVESSLNQQRISLGNNLPSQAFRYLCWQASVYHERKYLPTCDAVLAVSHHDLEFYKAFIPRTKLHVIPNFIDLSSYESYATPPNRSHPQLIFVGSMAAFQNRAAGEFLLSQIWPKISQAIPECQLFLVGSSPPEHWFAIQDPNVHVTGRVASPIPFLKSSQVAVVPLLHGSGTRLKILEAMACNIPIVSTALGCEGLEITNTIDIMVADTPDRFAERTIGLLKSPGQRSAIADNAYQLVKAEYSVEANRSKLYSLCTDLIRANRQSELV